MINNSSTLLHAAIFRGKRRGKVLKGKSAQNFSEDLTKSGQLYRSSIPKPCESIWESPKASTTTWRSKTNIPLLLQMDIMDFEFLNRSHCVTLGDWLLGHHVVPRPGKRPTQPSRLHSKVLNSMMAVLGALALGHQQHQTPHCHRKASRSSPSPYRHTARVSDVKSIGCRILSLVSRSPKPLHALGVSVK